MSVAWAWLRRNALLIYAGIAVLYMLLPIFVIALFSFDQTTFGRLDYTWSGFTLEYWQDAFSVTAVNDAMITSIQLAALATIVSTAIGTLMALALVRYQFRGRGASNLLIILPIYASLERMDVRLIEAAKDLYASSTKAFLKVTLPITAPGIVAGVLLTFIPAVGDYVNALLLGGTGQAMVGNVIQSLYLQQRDYPEAAALSFLMMAAILVVVAIYLKFAGTGAFMGEEDEAR